METLDLTIPEKYNGLIALDKSFVIVDLNSKKLAAERRDLAMDMIDYINGKFEKPIKEAHQHHLHLTQWRKAELARPEAARDFYKGKIQIYDLKQAELRQAAEETERDRLRKIEEDRRLAEAEALEKEGRIEEARALIEEEVHIPPVTIPIAAEEKVQSYRDNWSAVVVDRDAFFEAAYHNKSLRALWEPNQTGLNQQARSLKTMMQIPGVMVKNDPIAIQRCLPNEEESEN